MRTVNILSRRYIELTGAIHNHTSYSYDCDVGLDTILQAAHKNQLDYFTINDHHAIPDENVVREELQRVKTELGYEPFVITGSELNDPEDNHHLLTFGYNVPEGNRPVEEYIDEIKGKSGFLFAAHPYEKRICKDYPLYIWEKVELLEKVDGMEIWNYTSSWLSKLNPNRNGLFLVLFPSLFVKNPFQQNLILWDDLNRKGFRVAAIGSTDAHGTNHKFLFIHFRVLTHKFLFSTVRTNVLLPADVEPSNEAILQAIKMGNSYIINYRAGFPYNFYAGIGNNEEKVVSFGEEIRWEKNLKFFYMLPKYAVIKLIKDGEVVASQNNRYGSFSINSTGNFRLQIERLGAVWILTNYIYVINE